MPRRFSSVAGRPRARGAAISTAKQRGTASQLYYGGAAALAERRARPAAPGSPPLIDLGIAESFPTLGPILEAHGLSGSAGDRAAACISTGSAAMYADFGGSAELREAVARVMTENVLRCGRAGRLPAATADEIVVTAGATAALEAVAFAVAEDGDALIAPAPLYPAFYIDLGMRANVAVVPTTQLPAPPAASAAAAAQITAESLDEAAHRAEAAGHRVAGVIYTSPCNPSGRLHSRGEAAAVEEFVRQRGCHLIHDAVYAGTAFDEPSAVAASPVLAERLDKVHTVWGLAKDFGLSGWRVGAIHSRDPDVLAALQPQMRFAGASRVAQAAAAGLLGDPARARQCLRA
eukprot:SAG22_NODE_5099_length_1086_cov_2.242148_1_plen_347_part_10